MAVKKKLSAPRLVWVKINGDEYANVVCNLHLIIREVESAERRGIGGLSTVLLAAKSSLKSMTEEESDHGKD